MRISDWSSDVCSSDLYRCTDAAGHLTVQDSPCADDQSQQVRRMIQPTDPPPRAEPVEPAALQPAPEPRPQPVVVLHAPRPMYECVRDDGSRYTSADDEGNPRWISSWSSYGGPWRSEEHTSELQSLMRISYAV